MTEPKNAEHAEGPSHGSSADAPPEPSAGPPTGPSAERVRADANRRQALYWRLMARMFDAEEQPALESAAVGVVDAVGLPPALLDPAVSMDTLLQRFPELEPEFENLFAADGSEGSDGFGEAVGEGAVRNAALISKLLLNVFQTGQGNVSADQLAAWQRDATRLRRALCGGRGGGPGTGPTGRPGAGPESAGSG
ncbi:VWA containing CoxE family protein, partial [Actinomadura logoneensis]